MKGSGHDRIEVRSGICAGGTEKKHGKREDCRCPVRKSDFSLIGIRSVNPRDNSPDGAGYAHEFHTHFFMNARQGMPLFALICL